MPQWGDTWALLHSDRGVGKTKISFWEYIDGESHVGWKVVLVGVGAGVDGTEVRVWFGGGTEKSNLLTQSWSYMVRLWFLNWDSKMVTSLWGSLVPLAAWNKKIYLGIYLPTLGLTETSIYQTFTRLFNWLVHQATWPFSYQNFSLVIWIADKKSGNSMV